MNDYSKTNAAYFRRMGVPCKEITRYSAPVYGLISISAPTIIEILGHRFALRTWRDFRWSMIAREYEAGNLVCRMIGKDWRILSKATSYRIARIVREAKAAKKGKTNG